MTSSGGWPFQQIWEEPSFATCCAELSSRFNLSAQDMDTRLSGLKWALGADPTQFELVTGTNNIYVAVVRNFDHCPDFIVLFSFDLYDGSTTLRWVGSP